MSLKSRVEKIEQAETPVLGVAELMRAARDRVRRGEECTEKLPTLTELEAVIANPKSSSLAVRMAEGSIRVMRYVK